MGNNRMAKIDHGKCQILVHGQNGKNRLRLKTLELRVSGGIKEKGSQFSFLKALPNIANSSQNTAVSIQKLSIYSLYRIANKAQRGQ